MRGPISSLARQLQRDDTGERLLHGSKNGSHSILQSQKILKLIKAKNLLLPQHRRNPSWIELRIGSLGLLHRFGLGIGCVHHISNELGKTGKNRYRINAGGVASIECPVPTSFSGACTLNSKVHAKISGTAQTKMARKKTSNICRPALREIKVGKAFSRLDNGNRCWFGWSG
jgi:hypothetical protein